ncbi:MAG: glycerol-3-phosphate 1-O-acyltransferase PlsY [Ruminococcaceae bacterium]|nr:glycerol-3-phosphate 1-O-acyltransferase PlsY [Oscillospiraceae bacterium]
MMIMIVVCALIAYLLGSINTSILVSRAMGAGDIRKSGSGNAGATNTLRTLGKKAALFVVLGDALKGIAAIVIARLITSDDMGALPEYAAALFVVLGHNFPLYFGFKGGKGILTSLFVILMLDWRIGLIVAVISVAVIALSKYVSLGSMTGSALFPLLVLAFHWGNWWFAGLAVIMGALAIYMHRTNIKRLINGTESKLSVGKKSGGQ